MKLTNISLWILRVLPIFLIAHSLSWGQGFNKIDFDHLMDGTIYFRTSDSPPHSSDLKTYKTSLSDLNYLGALRPSEGEPYFLFTGKQCENCQGDRKIYVVRPTSPKPTPFVYPGKIFEPRTKALVLESQAFFGKCLPHRGDILIIFQKEKVDRRPRLQSSVIIAEATQSYLAETLLERHLPSVQTALQFVKRKTCFKIEGRNRIMASKAIELGVKSGISIEDSDDNDDDNNDNKNEIKEPSGS